MSKLGEIRSQFEAKIKNEPPGAFDPRDLERVKSDIYLDRLLHHRKNNVQDAVDMLYDIMSWRKNMKVNEINEKAVNMDYLKEGIFFPQGRDVDGSLLFIMKSKLYQKGKKNTEEVKRVIIYWLERIEREEEGKEITLFFDMDGCGLNNMDIDLTRYIVTLFDKYYPNFVNYVIVYQLPWMLSAALKIVKSMLPEESVAILKTINKDKLKDFVSPEQALVSWGGKNEYVFKFIPENRVRANKIPKTVTFSEDNQHSLGEMLSLSPNKLLTFKVENNSICSQLTITNMDDSVISYKIRTTAPEKYIVRPSSGILESKKSQTIKIQIIERRDGFHISSVEKDRFLVVSMQISKSNISSKDLIKIWNAVGSKSDEYRLKCSFVNDHNEIPEKSTTDQDSIDDKINNLQNSNEMLVQNLNTIKIYQRIILLLTFLSLVLGYVTYVNSKKYES